MAITPYLAMTAGEIRNASALPRRTGWLSCHFSASGTGLSNLPAALPSGSLLILDDSTPMDGHDPAQIAVQLEDCAKRRECAGILLDFQRPGAEGVQNLIARLEAAVSVPLIVSAAYAKSTECAVFLPPVPADVPLAEYLFPWRGREIWLEAALDGLEITLTETGAVRTSLPRWEQPEAEGFRDDRLHCHYRCELREEAAVFTLWRSPENLKALLAEAEGLGVTAAVGLYQELFPAFGSFPPDIQ